MNIILIVSLLAKTASRPLYSTCYSFHTVKCSSMQCAPLQLLGGSASRNSSTTFSHITLIVTESCVTENLRTQQLGNRTYCPSLSSDRSSRPYLGPSGSHNISDMAVQTPKILHGHITELSLCCDTHNITILVSS